MPESTVGAPLVGDLDSFAAHEEREFFLDFLQASDRKREPHLQALDEVWENYLVALPGQSGRPFLWPRSTGNVPSTFTTQQTRLKDPETHQAVESMTAQAMGLLFGAPEYVTTRPVGRGQDYDKARGLNRVIQGFMERPGEFLVDQQTIKTAFILGTAYQEIGYETRSRLQYVVVPVMDDMGIPRGRRIVPMDVIYRDRPLRRNIDPYDAYPDPNGTRIHVDMRGFAKRFEVYPEEALALSEPQSGQPPVYNRMAVMRAIQRSSDARGIHDSSFHRRADALGFRRGEQSRFMKKLVGFEYHGDSPIRRRDGFTRRTLTLLNGEMVRSHGLVYLGGRIPVKEFVLNPVPGRHWGLSPAEVIRFIQDVLDANLILTTDMMINSLYGPLLVGRGFGGDREALRNRHLRQLIEVSDPKKIAPVPIDYNAMVQAGVQYANLKQVAREATGASDPMQGIPTGGRPTATQISELTRVASQKVEAMIMPIERDDFPWIGETILDRFRQFMGDDSDVFMRFAGETFGFTLDEVDRDVDVKFVGSRFAMSNFQKGAAFREAIQTIAAGTQLIPIMPDLFIRYLRDALMIGDAEQLVAKAMMAATALGLVGGPQEAAEQENESMAAGVSGLTETGQAETEGRRLA